PASLRPVWDTLVSSSAVIRDGDQSLTIGSLMAKIARVTGVVFKVGSLPAGTGGQYKMADNSLTVNSSLLQEDRRALASVLAHELTHAAQAYAGDGVRGD